MTEMHNSAGEAMDDALAKQIDAIRELACCAFNTIHDLTAVGLFEQVLDVVGSGLDGADREVRRMELFGLLVEFVPRTSIERILAAQIVSTHTMAMDRLEKANVPDLSDSQRERAFKEAMRCLDMVARLTAQFHRQHASTSPPMRPETFSMGDREYTVFVDAAVPPFNPSPSLADIAREAAEEINRHSTTDADAAAPANPQPEAR
jgi:hypothetical protein